jgi:hypothetical protein
MAIAEERGSEIRKIELKSDNLGIDKTEHTLEILEGLFSHSGRKDGDKLNRWMDEWTFCEGTIRGIEKDS